MSRDPIDPGSRPARRDRPKSEPSRRPPPLPPDVDTGASTFRPNPAGSSAPAPGKPRKPKPKSDPLRDPLDQKVRRPAEGPNWLERILFGRVSSGQLAQFSRQFAAYLNAGVDISRSLNSLEKQFSGTALGPVIGRLQLAIKRGSTLEEAMAKEPQAFSPMYLSMIRVAEARGGVPETMKMLAGNLERRQSLVRQARSAMIYPTIVLMLAGTVGILISIFLLPMFAGILRELGKNSTLPWASLALMGFSQFVQVIGWWLLPLLLAGSPFLLMWFYRTPAGKSIMDRAVLMMPVFGVLCRKLDTSRFARTLSALLEAGLDFGTSIDLTADVVVMTPIRRAVRASREKVMAGDELSTTLDRSRQFTPDVIAVIATGEETGKLPETLEHLANDYDEQIEVMVKNLGELVKPLMTVILGLIVLFIILAVMLPIIQLMTNLAKP
jgi:type IV pilus assembly protein PilC